MITKPMLAVSCEDDWSIRYPVLATPKLDGIRCVVVGGRALSRKLKPIPNNYIRGMIEETCPDGFDGEIVIPGSSFNEVQSKVMSEEGEPGFQYAVFDYVKDSLDKSYTLRIKDLTNWMINHYQSVIPGQVPFVVALYPDLIESEQQLAIYEDSMVKQGYEGVMIRSVASPYKCGRSTLREGYLLKIKRFEDAEARVIGFEELMHNDNELEEDELGYSKRSSRKENLKASGTLGALLVRNEESGIEFSIGTGFDAQDRRRIWDNQRAYLGKLVTYRYQPAGMKEKPRFPTFKGFRSEDDT